ncbi:hypothetical protein ABVF61_07305 [Roseibium sp. HPY-6]|uniref:hypothetical protein n=1 Tax=Roseibium sp. HPY-6 TaxID=3229852 RepID=UPI00338FF0C3
MTMRLFNARRFFGSSMLALALITGTSLTAKAEGSIESSAIAAIAGPIAEEIAERFPRILPAIKGAIDNRKKKKQTKITQLKFTPLNNNAAKLFTTVKCGFHKDSKKGRMRFRRLNVWSNNKIIHENDVQSKVGAARQLTYAVTLRDFLDIDDLTEAVKGNAKSLTFVIRVEAKCETFNEKVANFNGWKSKKTTREIFVEMPLNLTDPERCKLLDTCRAVINPKIEVVSFRSHKRRYSGSCPAKVAFKAKVETTGKLSGKVWLEHEDGSTSKKTSWSMARAGSASSTLTRLVRADDANGRLRSKLVLRYRDANGKKRTVKSRAATYGVTCKRGLTSG